MLELFSLIMAGFLTTVSPCVLPVLPFVIASSLSKNKIGPVILCLGLAITFIGTTLILSRTGFILGLSPETVRKTAALLLILGASLFIFSKPQEFIEKWLARLIPRNNLANSNLKTELTAGMILGFLWTPCSGPSLGIALGFAAQAQTFWQALTMLFVFSLSASIPLLIIAYGSRRILVFVRDRPNLLNKIKKGFGLFVILWGVIIFFNLHYQIEIFWAESLPNSWLKFLLRF